MLELAFQHYPATAQAAPGALPLVILHGLMGSKRNWQSVAAEQQTVRDVYCVDLRNHGDSPHADEMSYQSMVTDIQAFIEKQLGQQSFILMGHSMGGKVGMAASLLNVFDEQCQQMVVVDIEPRAYPGWHLEMLAALQKVPLDTMRSRSEIKQYCIAHQVMQDPAELDFILQNLKRTQQGFEWQLNLPAIANAYLKIAAFPFVGQSVLNALFIMGETSAYGGESSVIMSHFPAAKVLSIKGAGHMPHVQASEAFNDCLKKNLL